MNTEQKNPKQETKPVRIDVRRMNMTPEEKARNQKIRAQWYVRVLALKANEPRVHF